MDKPITNPLRMTFLVHFIVGLVLGLACLLVPRTVANLFNFPLDGAEPYMRMIGAALLGYAASSWLGYTAHEWREVKIVVQAEIPWTLLGAAVSLWAVLTGTFPAAGWVNFALMALFFVAFTYLYWREETESVLKPA